MRPVPVTSRACCRRSGSSARAPGHSHRPRQPRPLDRGGGDAASAQDRCRRRCCPYVGGTVLGPEHPRTLTSSRPPRPLDWRGERDAAERPDQLAALPARGAATVLRLEHRGHPARCSPTSPRLDRAGRRRGRGPGPIRRTAAGRRAGVRRRAPRTRCALAPTSRLDRGSGGWRPRRPGRLAALLQSEDERVLGADAAGTLTSARNMASGPGRRGMRPERGSS